MATIIQIIQTLRKNLWTYYWWFRNLANQLRLVVTSHFSTTILYIPGGDRQTSINNFGICLVISAIPASLGHRCSRCSTSRKSFRHGWSWRWRSCLLLGIEICCLQYLWEIPIRVVPLKIATYYNILSSNTIIYQGVSQPTWTKNALSQCFIADIDSCHMFTEVMPCFWLRCCLKGPNTCAWSSLLGTSMCTLIRICISKCKHIVRYYKYTGNGSYIVMPN